MPHPHITPGSSRTAIQATTGRGPSPAALRPPNVRPVANPTTTIAATAVTTTVAGTVSHGDSR